jgi:hypothetical protein
MTDVAWRDVWNGRVWRAQAFRLVESTPEHVALWAPQGTEAKLPVDSGGRRLRIPCDEWMLEDVETSSETLCVARPGAAHSLYLFFEAGRFARWYVNFERPLRRTPLGFDTFDEKLDLVVEANGIPRWKDEDELEEAARLGLVDAAAVRAEAARVLAEWPFPTGWEDWRPDPRWPPPRLPEGWHVV